MLIINKKKNATHRKQITVNKSVKKIQNMAIDIEKKNGII